MVFGIDVSEFQTGVDYAKAVREGNVNFAILRAGYGRSANQKDSEFENHYSGFMAHGILLGAYQYSYTDSVAHARDEAHAMTEWCKGKSLPLGVWYDLEEERIRSLGTDTVCSIAETWIKEMEKAGFKAGVYASHSWFGDVLKPLKDKNIRIWSALWSNNDAPGYGICWQFGGETNLMRDKNVPGIPGTCDQDYWLESIDVAEPISPDEVTCSIKIRQLQTGTSGDDVRTMQTLLTISGYDIGDCGIDGDFGLDTEHALKLFQYAAALDADGICGPKTWDALING